MKSITAFYAQLLKIDVQHALKDISLLLPILLSTINAMFATILALHAMLMEPAAPVLLPMTFLAPAVSSVMIPDALLAQIMGIQAVLPVQQAGSSQVEFV